MGKRPLNLPFLGLQALLILIDCIAVAYVSPILVSFGYSPMRIERVMTLAAAGGHPLPDRYGVTSTTILRVPDRLRCWPPPQGSAATVCWFLGVTPAQQ